MSNTFHGTNAALCRILLTGCICLLIGRGVGNAQTTTPASFLCAQTLINGDVFLTWAPSPEGCGPFVEYDIYFSNSPGGPYNILTAITNIATTSYTHVGANGDFTTWYYYIVAVYDCPGYTFTSSDTLDNLDPVAPALDYVTVIGGNSYIYWFPSPSPETSSYIIYRDNGGFNAIDTVYGRFTTSYTDLTGSPTTHAETYTIAARDSCDNVGPFNVDSHHTVYLTVSQVNCTDQLDLSWNLYDTWTAGVSVYEIWVSVNGAPSAMVASLSNTSTTYTYSGFNDGDQLCIEVHAIRADGTAVSVSNSYCATFFTIRPAQYNVMRNGTVTGNQVSVEWYPDTNADIASFMVQRSTDNVSFDDIHQIFPVFPLPATESYTDATAIPSSRSYYYKVYSTDSCGTQKNSGYVRTIHLSGNDNANFTNSLQWNPFEMTNATVTGYNVYRDVGAGMVLLTTLGSPDLSFLDDVSSFVNVVDNFCYQVECTYDLNAPENGVIESLTSVSNTVCVEQGPRIYVPDAIVPDGINSVFKPVIVYGEPDGYDMKIFDRYGQVLFETNDINAGWDGMYQGKPVPLGTYGYLISFTATNGRHITKKGNVTVVR